MYDIPDKIFEQYNQAQVSTMMGLFAELNHAWISIDNALYLWDYTDPNPELIGFEEQPNSITAVKLVVPRAGVFVPQISRLLVVATTSDIFLLGVASQPTPTGSKQVSLYQTRMQVSIRGINVQSIAGSAKSGRIFFAGRGDDDVYELTYQQEEKWFQNKCAKVNRTSPGYTSIMPALPFMNKAPHEFVNQLVIDDTRNVLYTLSSRSTIRVFSLKSSNDLSLSLTRSLGSIMNDLGHKVGPTSLFRQGTSIVSLSAIAATEASRLNLIAITSTGCRIFFSAVSSSYYGGDAGNPPTSMQVHHVKFPPKDPLRSAPPQQQSPQGNSLTAFRSPPSGDDANTLTETRLTARLAPGYFLAFVQKNPQAPTDLLFVTAPDSGRIGNVQDTTQQAKFPEFGLWLNLESRAEDIGEVTPPFSATGSPNGFGNELAVQFDKSATELAVLTNSGVHTFRRRRMVDIFASAIRYGGGDEGLEGEVKNFVRIYGRGETIATAIAVACGQGSDVTADARIAKVTDPEVLERARKAFIEHGGKPVLNENSITDSAPAIDNVQPSPRHQGLALYISRLLRSIWKLPVVLQTTSPTGGLQMIPAVPLSKLQNVQQDLTRLQEFLNTNKSFIEGLAGPEALGRVSTKQEEVALQGEHRALNSLLNLVSDVIEGISFVLVLFDERVEEIVMSISDDSKRQVQQMTYETLFSTSQGKDLAKDLVKAIVNRNISQGSNVDTVTDALRRRCGSFCSADDCVIFKAQEQLKRASDQNVSGETSRNLLNESLRLLQKVAGSLTFDHLRNAVQQYISLNFYAGAIQLALSVAQESDRGNRALSWVHDGSPSNVGNPSLGRKQKADSSQDNRIQAYDSRVRCYDLIHQIISAVDQASAQEPGMMDGHPTVTAKRKQEAYDVINNSQDEVFQTNLYDWYLSQGWSDRLLDIDSPFVINYLQRKSAEEVAHADLLWRYYAHYDDFLEAAKVQLQLAKSAFGLDLEQRIEYLSRARANASTKSLGVASMGRPRQSRQELMREVSDMLDVANIQGDLLQKMKADSRLTAERRPEVLKQLNGQILPLDEIYNGYVDQAGYYDLALVVFQTADHRNATDIRGTWQNLIEGIHQETENADQILPYEAISDRVRSLGVRLSLSESTFPIRKSCLLLKH